MIKFLISFSLIFVICNLSNAQLQGLNNNADLKFNTNLTSKGGLKDANQEYTYEQLLEEYKNYTGSPFLFDEPKKVNLYDIEGAVIEGVYLNYDMLNNELIAKNVNGEMIPLQTDYYSHFEYNGSTSSDKIVYKKLEFDDNPARFVKLLLKSEDFSFFKDYKMKIYNNSRHIAGVDVEDKRISSKEQYYLLHKDGSLKKTKLNKKKFGKSLPKNYSRGWKRITSGRKSKLEFKNENDYVFALQTVIDAYNEK